MTSWSANANASALNSSAAAAVVAGAYRMPSAPAPAKAAKLTPAEAMASVLERSLCSPQMAFLGLEGRSLQLIRSYASSKSEKEPDFDELLFGEEAMPVAERMTPQVKRIVTAVSKGLPPDVVERIGTFLPPPEMALFTVLQSADRVTSLTCTRLPLDVVECIGSFLPPDEMALALKPEVSAASFKCTWMLLDATTKDFRKQARALGLMSRFSEIRAWNLLMLLHRENVPTNSDGLALLQSQNLTRLFHPPHWTLHEFDQFVRRARPVTTDAVTMSAWTEQHARALGKISRLTAPNIALTLLPTNLMASLTGLRSLDLSHNHLLALPESLGNLTRLEQLILSNNRLKALPESLGNLTRLMQLMINSNRLESLPESFGNLIELRILSLSDNFLKSLPESFGNFTHLGILFLDNNRLESLPGSLGNLGLSKLSLNNNRLTAVPSTLRALRPWALLLEGNPLRNSNDPYEEPAPSNRNAAAQEKPV